MSLAPRFAAGVAAMALLGGGYAVATFTDSEAQVVASTPTSMGCEDWQGTFTQGECFAAGTLRYVALHNLQGAAQFCVWRRANPGEWSRLKGYAETEIPPQSIVTWFGGAIRNQLEAYFATGAPMFTIRQNTAPNVCGRKLLASPVVQGVTPGETDVTVTINP